MRTCSNFEYAARFLLESPMHLGGSTLNLRAISALHGVLPLWCVKPLRSRLMNTAARLMQVCQNACLTLQRIKTGGKQTVVVQHVQVSDGGQAVIAASVEAGDQGGQKGG